MTDIIKSNTLRTYPIILQPSEVVTKADGDQDGPRKARALITDEARDRHGTVIKFEAWKWDNFRNNPIVAFMHKTGPDYLTGEFDPDNIIGSGEIEADEANRGYYGTTTFETLAEHKNAMSEKLWPKIALSKTIRAVSVGFIWEKGHWGLEDDGEDTGTYYFDSVDGIEYSYVVIPSNPNAFNKSFENSYNQFLINETGPQGREVVEERTRKAIEANPKLAKGMSLRKAKFHFLTLS